eukprot:14392931-Alexandrium_andersonii.AAC.1
MPNQRAPASHVDPYGLLRGLPSEAPRRLGPRPAQVGLERRGVRRVSPLRRHGALPRARGRLARD